MANEIKQIKVGDITYNIEPYTSYLPLAGGHMSGDIKMTENSTSIIFRSASADWYSGIYANSSGDEVLGIVVANPRTHIMLGTADPTERPACTSLTPAIDIKNGKVGINKRLGTDSSADAGSYELDVNGSVKVGDLMKIDTNGACLNVGTSTSPDWRKISYHINHNGENDSNDSSAGSYSYVIGKGNAGNESMVWTDTSDAVAGDRSVLIGGYSDTNPYAGEDSVVIGNNAGGQTKSVAIGANTNATTGYGTVLGYNAGVSGGTGCSAIGYSAKAYGVSTIAIGTNAVSTGSYNTVLGCLSKNITGQNNVAVGYNAKTNTGSYSTVIGSNTNTHANYNVAIGYNAKAGTYSTTAASCMHGQIAIGYNATTTKGGTGSIVIGYSSSITGVSIAPSIVIGPYSTAYTTQTNDSYNYDKGEIVIGTRASSTGSGSNIVIGNGNSTYKALANGYNSIAIGSAMGGNWETSYGARVYGAYSIAIGSSAYATGSNAIAIGRSASASGSYAIAIGTSISSGVSGSYGLVKIGNSSNNYTNHDGTTSSWSRRSDIRDKIDIEPLTDCLEVIKSIQPILYRDNPRFAYGGYFEYDEEEYKKGTKAYLEYCAGFKAQEVANIMEKRYGDEKFNHIVGHEFMHNDITGEDADYYTMSYGDLIPFVFQAVREQQEIIEELQEQNKILTEKIEEILKRVG